ncbi:MAG: hypothetical protein QM487_04530 [Candidatus Marithrix sp.]
MLIGIAIVGITLMILLFFGILTPSAGNETMIFEIIGLLIIGACVGFTVGFFDMLDHGIISNDQYKKYERNNDLRKLT